MPVLASQLNPRSDEFKAHAKAMQAMVDDLRAQQAQAALGGGAAARERHTARGKLLPRERVERLLDPGTPFLEIGALAALGATLKEGEGGAPRGGQGGSKLTPVEARAKANSLMQRSQELRGKGNAAEADRLHKEAGDYFRMAHGA